MKESNKDKNNKIKKLEQQINSQQKIINLLTKTMSTKLSCLVSLCNEKTVSRRWSMSVPKS